MIRPTPEDQAYFTECIRRRLEIAELDPGEDRQEGLRDLLRDQPYYADGVIDDLTPDF